MIVPIIPVILRSIADLEDQEFESACSELETSMGAFVLTNLQENDIDLVSEVMEKIMLKCC